MTISKGERLIKRNIMEERTIDRLLRFIDYLKKMKEVNSIKAFEDECGLSNGYIANSKKSNGSIGSDMLARMVNRFPKLNLLWLCTGRGEMLINPVEKVSKNYKEAYEGAMMQVDALRKILNDK